MPRKDFSDLALPVPTLESENMKIAKNGGNPSARNNQIPGSSSRISPQRRQRVQRRKRLSLLGLAAAFAMITSVMVFTGQDTSQAAGPGAAWKNYGNSKLELNARKSTDGSKVAVCATDRQINSPRNKWINYQGSRVIGAGQAYRSNRATFEVKDKVKGTTVVFPAAQEYRVAYLAGQLRGAIDKGDPELGATVYAIHSLSGRLTPKQNPSAQIKRRAQQLLSQAAAYAGPYRMGTPEIKTNPGTTQGTLRVPVLQSAAGRPMSGLSESITLTGPAHFSSTGQPKTLAASSAGAVKELPIEVTGPGKVSAQVQISGLPPVSYEIWEHPRWQDLLIAGPKSQISASIATNVEPRQFFAVKTQTQSQMKPLAQGAELTDSILVKPEEKWGKTTGKDSWQTGMIDLSVYGPFSSARGPGQIPAESQPLKTWQLGATPKNAEEAEKGVTISNETDPYKIDKPGFYTFVAAVHRTSQPEDTYLKTDYLPDFFEEAETQVLPYTPGVKTQAKVVVDKEQKILTDQVELSGFPDDHPDFGGSGNWQADEQVVHNDLYCLPQPIKDQDAQRREPLARVELPAKNGTYSVDKDKEGKPLSLDRFTCKDTYVFVTTYRGDSRTNAFRTSEPEIDEQYSLPKIPPPPTSPNNPPPSPERPTVLSATGASTATPLAVGLVALGCGGLLVSHRARRK